MTAYPQLISDLAAEIQFKRQEKIEELCALQTSLAISTMNPRTRENLIVYLHDLNKAQELGDSKACQYLISAIAELFHHYEPADFGEAATLEAWEAEIESTPEGREAMRKERAAQAEFQAAYRRLKERAGFRTQQEVADAAGLSPTTVRKVESGGCRPHFGTLSKLAKAFNVSVEELWKRAS